MIAMILTAQQCSCAPKGQGADLHISFKTPYIAKEKEKHIQGQFILLVSGSMNGLEKAYLYLCLSSMYLCWKLKLWVTKAERILI